MNKNKKQIKNKNKEKRNKNYLFLAKTFNPLVLILYGVFCFYLYSLSQYGGIKRKIPIIVSSLFILIVWFFWSYHNKNKSKKEIYEKSHIDEMRYTGSNKKADKSKRENISKIWFFTACLILIFTTFITGINIYKSSIAYNGKLSWVIEDLKNKREVKFIDNNIYENNIEGILDSIEEKIELPENLYISSDFQIKFKEDGTIVAVDTFLYGKNIDGEVESFLISYDEIKSEKIIVYLSGYVQASFSEEEKLEEFANMLKTENLKEKAYPLYQDIYEISYSILKNAEEYLSDDEITYDDEITNNVSDMEDKPKLDLGYNYNEGEETFFLDEKHGFQLSIVDAALGSRFYNLLETKDGGKNWETINIDPYLNRTGVSAGIKFIDESLGFIALSHNGGTESELYRTIDGGLSYKEVSLPSVEVSLGEDIQRPFDSPEMPYEENGKIQLLVGQGQDGDYKRGIKALFESQDYGETWSFVKEK